MPRAWYAFVGAQNATDYNTLSKYQLITNQFGVNYEPSCNSDYSICAVYAIGTRVAGVQSFNPTSISYPLSFFSAALADGASQPPTGGANPQGRPYYVRVKP